MMEKEKLRKADIFSGSLICLAGLWIIGQALKMPMKDSWGGVQNVWFVSPAIFPLFVGAMIALLGALLIRTAMKAVGLAALANVLRWLGSPGLLVYLKTAAVMRFYAMVVLLLSYVYLYIPRVDFFLCSVLFLLVFISMFYLDDDIILKKLFLIYLGGTIFTMAFFIAGIPEILNSSLPFAGDWLIILFTGATIILTLKIIRNRPSLRKKYRLSIILALAAPFLIGVIFKYFLLVPMPTEGLAVAVLDAVWYWDF